MWPCRCSTPFRNPTGGFTMAVLAAAAAAAAAQPAADVRRATGHRPHGAAGRQGGRGGARWRLGTRWPQPVAEAVDRRRQPEPVGDVRDATVRARGRARSYRQPGLHRWQRGEPGGQHPRWRRSGDHEGGIHDGRGRHRARGCSGRCVGRGEVRRRSALDGGGHRRKVRGGPGRRSGRRADLPGHRGGRRLRDRKGRRRRRRSSGRLSARRGGGRCLGRARTASRTRNTRSPTSKSNARLEASRQTGQTGS